jgi:uncharacterized protein YkwD
MTDTRAISALYRGTHRRRRRSGLALAAVPVGGLFASLAFGSATAFADTSTTAAGPVKGFAGQCLDDRGAGTQNFNPVQVWNCNGTGAQQWTYSSSDQTMQALGMCLDVEHGATADGTPVELYTCNGTGAQHWVEQTDGALYNPQSGKCLDDTNWSSNPGTQAQIWDCTGNANQSWGDPAAAQQTAAPSQPSSSSTSGLSDAEQQVFDMINQERAQNGLSALTVDPGLMASSEQHNHTMLSGCGLSHQCSGEAALGDRETSNGVHWSFAAENIGEFGPVSASFTEAQAAVSLNGDMYAEQPPDDGHRLNILSTSATRVGVAVDVDSKGTVWLTEDFAG